MGKGEKKERSITLAAGSYRMIIYSLEMLAKNAEQNCKTLR